MATTSRTRWILIAALAGAVLIAAIALIIANRGGAKAGAVDRAADPASGSATAVLPETPSTAPSLAQPAQPGAPTREPETPTPSIDTVSDTGAAVHDHRGDPGELHDHPVLPTNGKVVRVGGQFAGSVAGLVTPIARECASQIPADARGARPVIQVQLTVTIKDGKMTVDGVDTELTDVTGDQSAVKDCVKSKAASVSIDATGQPDVDHYAITMPMRVAS